MQKHVQTFNGKKYPLRFVEANMFSRDQSMLLVISKLYSRQRIFSCMSGPLICSDSSSLNTVTFFQLVCPDYSFERFFYKSSDEIGKSFDPQKLIRQWFNEIMSKCNGIKV